MVHFDLSSLKFLSFVADLYQMNTLFQCMYNYVYFHIHTTYHLEIHYYLSLNLPRNEYVYSIIYYKLTHHFIIFRLTPTFPLLTRKLVIFSASQRFDAVVCGCCFIPALSFICSDWLVNCKLDV